MLAAMLRLLNITTCYLYIIIAITPFRRFADYGLLPADGHLRRCFDYASYAIISPLLISICFRCRHFRHDAATSALPMAVRYCYYAADADDAAAA